MELTLDNVAKQVKDVADALKKAHDDQKEAIKLQVEETLKTVLRGHPGLTPERRLPFQASATTPVEEILAETPKEIQAEMDKLFILSHALNRPIKSLKSWNGFVRKAGDFKKALDTATATEGQEWVPTALSPELFRLVRLQLRVAALFPTISMPTPTYELPVQIGRFQSYKHSQQTADTGQTKVTKTSGANTTGKTTFTAVPHAVEVLVSDEATEDSIVPMMPFIQQEIVQTLAEGREDFILNGDTNATHEDSDTTDSDSRRKIALGLRALAHDNAYETDLATFTLDNIRSMRGDMGKYGVMPQNLAIITGIKGYIKLLGLDEVVTVDKYGAGATVLAGELGKIDGMPIVVSEWVRENLNASGVYDGSVTTKTALLLAHRNAFAIGERTNASDIKVLRELYAESAQIALLARERVDFQPLYPASSNPTVWVGQNIE